MKKLISFFNIENLKTNLKEMIFRFPISAWLIVIIAFMSLSMVHIDYSIYLEKEILRLTTAFILSFFFSVWIELFSEKTNTKYKQTYHIITLLFAIGFWYYFDINSYSDENIVLFILTLISTISFIYISPFLSKLCPNSENQIKYFNFLYEITKVVLFSFILWIVLTILWSLWIFSVTELFWFNFISEQKLYLDWLIIANVMFAPSFFLINIKRDKEIDDKVEVLKFYKFIIKYVWVPFIYIYFFILYAYSIKVLSNFSDWPNWIISRLVIFFSLFWYIIYSFSYILEEESKSVKFFRRYFPYVVIPQIIMLFYAIYLRIDQYSLTINRYFVVAFWIWLTIISIYYVVSKRKYLWFISLSLISAIIIISIWPWGVYRLPENIQFNKLKNILEKNNILVNGQIFPLENSQDITSENSSEINSIITYLCNSTDCKQIKDMFREQLLKKRDLDLDYKYEIIETIITELNLNLASWYWVYNYIYTENIFPIDIRWYDYISEINNSYLGNRSTERFLYSIYDKKDDEIVIYNNWLRIERISIKENLDNLKSLYKGNNKVEKDEMVFEIKKNSFQIKVIIENFSYYNNENSNYINWYIAIKELKE